MFKALANPHRLRLFRRLVSCCEPGTRCRAGASTSASACVGALGAELDIAPSTVSHHIRVLHQAGLIQMERRGQFVECWVDPDTLAALAGFFAGPAAPRRPRGRAGEVLALQGKRKHERTHGS